MLKRDAVARRRPGETAELVLEEHRALQSLIADIDAILLITTPSRIPSSLFPRLADLEVALEAHFAHEEDGGLFEQLVEEAPETAVAAAALLREHRRLRARTAALRTRALVAGGGPALATSVRRLLRDLVRHESRENELLLAVLDTASAALD
jgi:hemerythrin-like domain-containing protein